MRPREDIGLAVIGCGRIGGHRARVASTHPGVTHLALADPNAESARNLAEIVGADEWSTDSKEIISRAEISAVLVSTPEGLHTDAVLYALSMGKSVLVEKPIALTLADADLMIAASEGTQLQVGYTRRFRRRYRVAKEQIVQGRMGSLVGATARVYNSREQALAMLGRDPDATPVVDALTYYVDLMQWFLADDRLNEVVAMANQGVLASHGHAADDVTFALLRYESGAVISLGVSYALPSHFPAQGHAARLELIGTDGVILIDDDHTDQVMYTDHGVPHVYLPDQSVNAVFLSSGTPGDWAGGELVGPLTAETRAWLDHLSMGTPSILATPLEARRTLEATLAIEQAVRTRASVSLPLV